MKVQYVRKIYRRRMGKKKTRSASAYMRLIDDEMEEEDRIPKGYVPMLVGTEEEEKEMERFLIHTKLFGHPHFVALLEMAALEFGYEQQGMLRIPCDAECFRKMVNMISKAK